MVIINTILYIILIIEIILLIYYRKVVFSLIIGLLGKKKEKPEKIKSEYEEIKSYIIKEHDKGYTFEQISEALLKADWDKEMIDFAMNEIMKRKQH